MTAGTGFEDLLRRIVREEVRAVIREELAATLSTLGPATPPEPLAERRHLTLDEVAEVAGVSERTVRRWVRGGDLRGRTLGRLVRVERAELERFLAGHSGVQSKATVDEVVVDILSRTKR